MNLPPTGPGLSHTKETVSFGGERERVPQSAWLLSNKIEAEFGSKSHQEVVCSSPDPRGPKLAGRDGGGGTVGRQCKHGGMPGSLLTASPLGSGPHCLLCSLHLSWHLTGSSCLLTPSVSSQGFHASGGQVPCGPRLCGLCAAWGAADKGALSS